MLLKKILGERENNMIIFEEEEYKSFTDLDLNIGMIGLKRENGGEYFTVLPVSPISYRKKSPTQAKVDIKKYNKKLIIDITSDYGTIHTLIISGHSIKDLILVKALKEYVDIPVEIN